MHEDVPSNTVENADRPARPVVSSGIDPRPLRFLFLSHSIRGGVTLTIVALVATVVLLFLGRFLWNTGGVKTPMIGGVLFAAGVLAGLIALLIPVLTLAGIPRAFREFRDHPLVPGILVSTRPRHVVVMVETGKSFPGYVYSLSRIEPHTLGISHPEVGARIPCYTRPVEDYENDNIHQVIADVIACGTSDPFALQQCDEKIGSDRYRLLEEAIRRGTLPEGGFHQVFLDGDLNYVGCWRSRFDKPAAGPEPEQAGEVVSG